MARTASMTISEAETILGPRGELRIFSSKDEKLFVARKWLTAKGAPGKYSNGCPRWLAARVYNDATDAEFRRYVEQANAFNAKKGNAAETTATETTATETTATETTATETAATETAATETAATIKNDGTAGSTLASLVAPYILQQILQGVHEAVNKRLESVQTVRIEIARQDGTTAAVDGHQHPKMADLLLAMASRQSNGHHPNIMLKGPTGSGKTHAVGQAAKAMGLEFFTNGAITMDHQLIGWRDANGNYHSTPLREAFGQPAVYLFDEIDSSDNSPLLCLAGLLANGGFHFPDAYVTRHPDAIIIAAGNTWGEGANSDFVGRNRLDGAIRSRFPTRIYWGYDEILESAICGNPQWAARVQHARAKAFQAGLKVIIDPRMSQAGAALIAQGASFDKAAEMTYLADLTQEQRDIIEARG